MFDSNFGNSLVVSNYQNKKLKNQFVFQEEVVTDAFSVRCSFDSLLKW